MIPIKYLIFKNIQVNRSNRIRMLGEMCRAAQSIRVVSNVSLIKLKDPDQIPIHPDYDYDDEIDLSHRGQMLYVSTQTIW